MKSVVKVAMVLAGYVAAFVADGLAGWWYDVRVSKLPYDTSGGMYAGGKFMTEVSAFLVVSLVPTLLGLWFLRRHHRVWNVVAGASLAFAGVGLLAVLMPLVVHHTPRQMTLLLLSLLGLTQLLGVPLWTVAFVLFAFLAPTRRSRRVLIVAIGLELVIGVCAFVHWNVPRPPF